MTYSRVCGENGPKDKCVSALAIVGTTDQTSCARNTMIGHPRHKRSPNAALSKSLYPLSSCGPVMKTSRALMQSNLHPSQRWLLVVPSVRFVHPYAATHPNPRLPHREIVHQYSAYLFRPQHSRGRFLPLQVGRYAPRRLPMSIP